MNLTITRTEGYLRVNPAPPYLTAYLQYSHRSFELVNYRRVSKFSTKLLHRTDGEGGLITLQGFFEKICALIHKHNDTYVVDDKRVPLPAIDWLRVKEIGPRDYQVEPLTEFLFKAQVNSGIVSASGGFGKTHLQMMTYAAFHSMNTILVIPLKEIFNQTYQKFVQYFPDKHIGKVGDGVRDISKDITISTFRSLKNCALEKCELLMADEIQCTTGDQISDILVSMRPRRVFGYTATDSGLFSNADKVIKGLFGERLIHIPYQEAEELKAVVPGLVYFVDMPEDTPRVYSNDWEQRIIKGVKNCEKRNALIGEICKLVPDKWQTLVFVDHIQDHLRNLVKHMPTGTRFIHRESSKDRVGNLALSSKAQKLVLSEFLDNEFQYLIGTDCTGVGFDVPNCRVVVQASSGGSEIEILQEAFRGSRTLSEARRQELGVEPKTHFVLIDIMDLHEDKLAELSHKRMEIYRKQGWKIKRVKSPAEIDWKDYKPETVKLI